MDNDRPFATPPPKKRSPFGRRPRQPKLNTQPKPPKKHWWHRWHNFSRKQKIISVGVGVLVLLAIVVGVGLALHKSPVAIIKKSKPVAAKPTTVASPLTGVQVAPALAARPVTGIMIENSDDARPQSGLQDAGVVYEAIAEGGITRFLALFQDSTPQYIGPIRSLRPYYIDFAAPFEASIVHVGGSSDALSQVQNGRYRNLDQFSNGDYFTRISSRDAPHNVYTSFGSLDKLNASKGYTKSKFSSWARKADHKLVTPTAKTINLAISSPDFYSHYDYNATTDSYLRSEGGAPHKDLVSATDTTGVELNPKVVVAIVVPLSNGILDASNAYYSNYADSGTGTAYIFQDGSVTVGTWTKPGTTGQLEFADSQGKGVKLNAGQTWVSLVSAASQVTYSP